MKNENTMIDDYLYSIDEYESKSIELDIERDIAWRKFLVEKGHKYNTSTSYSIKLLKENNHNPLAICSYYAEETFFFKTAEEAKKAYDEMEEKKGLVCGWFHSVEEIEELGLKDKVEWIE